MKPSNVIDLERARLGTSSANAAAPARASAPATAPRRGRPRRIIAVGGGKGGIGKTMVSANLGVALARQGSRVLLVDADLGGANLHTSLGVAPPEHSLSDFVSRKFERIEDVVVPTGIENVSLIAGAQDVLDAANPKYQQKLKLLRNLLTIDSDYLILDLGAGTSFNVLDFFLIADHGVLVILPEPTSVENAYRFVKAAFFRRLQYIEEQLGIQDIVAEALSSKEGAIRTPFEFVARVKARNPDVGQKLEKELDAFRVKLVVNQARGTADLGVGPAVVSSWKKFFGLDMELLGSIRYDDEAWKAVRKRKPVLIERPQSEAATGLQQIAERLMALDGHVVTAP